MYKPAYLVGNKRIAYVILTLFVRTNIPANAIWKTRLDSLHANEIIKNISLRE